MSGQPFDPGFAAELLTALPDGVLVADRDLRIAQTNPAADAMLGWTPGALTGRALADLYWDPSEGASLVLADRGSRTSSARALRTEAGERRIFLVQGLEVGERIVLVVRGVGDLRDTLDHLVRSEASLRAVIERSPDCICVHHENRLVYVNKTWLEMWGGPIEELMGMPAHELAHPDERPIVRERQRALAAGQPVPPYMDERLLRRDGSVWVAQVGAVNIVYEGKPSVLVVARDVTEHRQLQASLAKVDRMVAVGTMAAGVAHEIGNPLTYVLLRLDAATVRTGELRRALAAVGPGLLPIVDDLAGHLAAVIDGARRVRTCVAELRVFANPDQADEPRRFDVTMPTS